MKRTERKGRLSSRRKLLSASWATDVDAIETAISRFETAHPLATDCEVVFFEIASDEMLHVNVTHQRRPEAIRGWAGPAHTPDGFVHNRTFGNATSTTSIVGHVRQMIFADDMRQILTR